MPRLDRGWFMFLDRAWGRSWCCQLCCGGCGEEARVGQVGKQILRAHRAGGRKRWSVLRPQGAHLQPRPAGGGSWRSCPHQFTAEPSTWAPASRSSCKGHSKDRELGKEQFRRTNSQGCLLERRTGGFRARRARTPRARLESTTSFFNLLYGHGCAAGISQLQRALQSEQESILAPCCAQEAGFSPRESALEDSHLTEPV